MIAGTQVPAGCGVSTVIPEMDFETFSEAGFIWDESTRSYKKPKGAQKKGIFAVGAVVYSEHESADTLCLSYDLKDGLGERLWVPWMPHPQELFDHIAAGGLIESVNCQFENWWWNNVCVPKLGWPPLPWWQQRDAAAKFRAHGYPGGLEAAAKVSGATIQKMTEGKRLITKFSCPRKPTKKDPRRRIRPEEDTKDGQLLYDYCIGDIKAESSASMLCPDLSPTETEYELCTRATNVRGLALDTVTVNAGAAILDQALVKYNRELELLTCAQVEKASEVQKLKTWLAETHGIHTDSLDADAMKHLLSRDNLAPNARRALEIRQLVGSAGVKKLYAMQRMASKAGRVHDLIIYHGAKTGRDNGRDLQPLNLVKAGPALNWCNVCEKPYGRGVFPCPHCLNPYPRYDKQSAWSYKAVEHAVEVIRTGRLEEVERVFGDALLTLSGCIRGMFVPAPSHDFVCSDYSSIEAVVTAMLAGEQWRIDAFHRKEDIYLHSASRTTGTPLEEYVRHKQETDEHHPDRQKIGKPQELGLGFGGWIGAWRQFDSSDNFSDDEVKNNIKAWRAASPSIVELWGGQVRGLPWAPERYELFGLEGAAINAIQNPGSYFSYRGLTFAVKDGILYGRLLSGRLLVYHKPRLSPSTRWDGQLEISFEGWNTNPKKGPIGWIRMHTYGGDLAQGFIQATARDIMFYSLPNLERAGYPIVLRVHDELVAEVPEGFGSIEELEKIMGTLPAWAEGWPVRAAGGWRGKRYRKD